MSSSSFEAETPPGSAVGELGDLVADSFETLAREAEALYGRLCRQLSGHSIAIQVDDDGFVVCFAEGRASVETSAPRVDARVTTSARAIDDLLDGRIALADSILADDVRAVAPLELLVVLHAGLRIYLHGAVRSPSFPALLERFQRLATSETEAQPAALPLHRDAPEDRSPT